MNIFIIIPFYFVICLCCFWCRNGCKGLIMESNFWLISI